MINEKINFWLWAGWVVSYLQRSLSAQVNGGGGGGGGVQRPPLTAENSHLLQSGSQGAALVMTYMEIHTVKYIFVWIKQ